MGAGGTKKCRVKSFALFYSSFKSLGSKKQFFLVEIRTLVAWLKSTLLLKIKLFYTHVYKKTHYLERKMLEKLGEERKVLALIKSLI